MVLHPVTGMIGPPSRAPTLCPPMNPAKLPSRIDAPCASVGRVIRNAMPAPNSEITVPARTAKVSGRSPTRRYIR
ncbi:hypothetical protein GCM10023321_40940 [Pseudonocardia eucalypti]|uniref:Uncharacterized protein n=1 Tax=Pseudonocardia eucalypti TaxID=648755 RepID=A0ABP9QCG5_9PSEU